MVQMGLLNDVNTQLTEVDEALVKLKFLLENVSEIGDIKEKAYYFKDNIIPAMAKLRKPVDNLETIVDKRTWPLPSYADLMFEV